MNPVDFIALAIKLSSSRNEADLRSAVSRAYYGAFHVARQFLGDCGVRFSAKELYAAEIHKKVRFCLGESGNADAHLAGDNLRTLRSQRNEADYNLESTDFLVRGGVMVTVRLAPEIVDAFQRCRAEPAFSEARAKIRSYARDVLRIAVDET
ncbi:MAG TPA: hypothetical protein VJ783_12160 [Pirellulales bacterium]|nr:hypothetical protein [Pirellulales bacterium]